MATLPKEFQPNELFRVELSSEEMHYLTHVLPPGYSLILEPKKSLPKHILQALRKKANQHNEDSNSHINSRAESENKKNANSVSKSAGNKEKNNEKVVVQKNGNPPNKWADQLPVEWMKKAAKILTLLKAHKNAWPFLEPVDAEALGIPEYYDMIKEPMDLRTVEEKLKALKYSDFSEFNSDITKIVSNSLKFNEANPDYIKLTTDFESYYLKILSESQGKPVSKSSSTSKKKKPSPNATREIQEIPLTTEEKKKLASDLRRLGKEHLPQISRIVFGEGVSGEGFDLEKIGDKKVRELLKFLNSKIQAMEERKSEIQHCEEQVTNLDLMESDTSQFLEDSLENQVF